TEEVGEHPDVFGFKVGFGGGKWRTKESKPRGAADIDRASTGIEEPVPANFNIRRPAFALDGVAIFSEQGAGDEPTMTPDVVDAAAPGADLAELGIQDIKVVNPREFQPIVIPTGADLVKKEIAEKKV